MDATLFRVAYNIVKSGHFIDRAKKNVKKVMQNNIMFFIFTIDFLFEENLLILRSL